MTRHFWLSAWICGWAAVALAQQGTIAGPVAGFAFDSSAGVLRPIQGIPGAAVLGDAVNFGIDVANAVVSPRLDSAIVVAADQSVHAFQLQSGVPGALALNGVSAAPERIAFSPSGTAVVLYGAGRVQVVTGLPSAPALSGAFDFMPGGGGQAGTASRAHRQFAGSLAVSDDGSLVLIADGAAVQLFQAGAGRLAANARNALVAFAPGGHDAAVVDPGGAGVLWIRNLDGASTQQTLGAANSAVGVAFSADGKTLYVAGGAVVAFDLAGGAPSSIVCNCTPTGLVPMGAVFRLNEIGAGPLWLLDPTAAPPRTVFVPARAE